MTKAIKYRVLVGRFLSSLLVVLRHISQNAVDTKVRPVRKHPLAVGAVFGLVSCPVVAQAGQAEAVSTWYGHWVGEDVSTQRAQEVFLWEEADGGGHAVKISMD